MAHSGTTSHQREHDRDRARSLSGSILSKLSFLARTPPTPEDIPGDDDEDEDEQNPSPQQQRQQQHSKKASRSSLAVVVQHQQQKTRRRKGSLRKAALLGRGAQRERRESRLNNTTPTLYDQHPQGLDGTVDTREEREQAVVGLGIISADDTPRPSMDGYARRSSTTIKHEEDEAQLPPLQTCRSQEDLLLLSAATTTTNTTRSPSITAYTSTTSEEDLPTHYQQSPTLASQPSQSTDSECYFPSLPPSLLRRRSSHHSHQPPTNPHPPKPGTSTTNTIPLSLSHTPPLPTPSSDWDYSDTEWWGWIILLSTWLVFVVGMGSCTGVWSWAWDVGETAPAPPELEDDATLPIVGYYPALMLLTCVMAWVWVVVAWVGMKYFRHAKISGD